jgi:hypothetical protein
MIKTAVRMATPFISTRIDAAMHKPRTAPIQDLKTRPQLDWMGGRRAPTRRSRRCVEYVVKQKTITLSQQPAVENGTVTEKLQVLLHKAAAGLCPG